MLRILIVEDEPLSCMFLKALIAEHFPEAQIVATAASEDEAVAAMATYQPDAVLMDIELQTGTGFGVLQRLPQTDAFIIFTTALDHDATVMLRLCGAPYISKPVDVESLTAALTPASFYAARKKNEVAMVHLRTALQNGGKPHVMRISDTDAPEYVSIADIVSICQYDEGCSLALKSGGTRTTHCNLKELEALLKDLGFFRTQLHCLVARHHVVGVEPGDDAIVRLSDGSTAPVSPKKLLAFHAFMAGD